MKYTDILTHITDTGFPHGNGSDSTYRIQKQYQALGINSNIISAGNSPLHVAFTACAELSPHAKDCAKKTLQTLDKKYSAPVVPVALNCAPRNHKQSLKEAKEDYAFRVTRPGVFSFIIYGFEVVKWVLTFQRTDDILVEKIMGIKGIIRNTSIGSQFRSSEYLPIIHFLEAHKQLDAYIIKEKVSIKDIILPLTSNEQAIILPPDEYKNGRILVQRELLKKIRQAPTIKINLANKLALAYRSSLTEVIPGDISLWPSSNYFINERLHVLNIGTRWKPKTTYTSDNNVMRMSETLALRVGENIQLDLFD
jgi:hypothetical protein